LYRRMRSRIMRARSGGSLANSRSRSSGAIWFQRSIGLRGGRAVAAVLFESGAGPANPTPPAMLLATNTTLTAQAVEAVSLETVRVLQFKTPLISHLRVRAVCRM